MNTTPVNVSITTHQGETRSVDSFVLNVQDESFAAVEAIHETLSRENPESFVNMDWGGKPTFGGTCSFICGMRWGQKLDEEKLDRDEITWEQYSRKWYGQG